MRGLDRTLLGTTRSRIAIVLEAMLDGRGFDFDGKPGARFLIPGQARTPPYFRLPAADLGLPMVR